MRIILLLLVLLLPAASYAAEDTTIMEKEIQHLFDYIQSSECKFNRNGKWHTAEEAWKHIHTKYTYLAKKGRIDSTEQFIERAASKSSMSGKPYMISCAKSDPITSAAWFTNELMNFREKNTVGR